MKKASFRLFFKVLFGSVIFISCTKEESDLTSAHNNNIADAAFNHINSVIDAELAFFENQFDINKINSFISKEHDSCSDITLSLSSDSSYIDSLLIDYGEKGCKWKERTKTGKILITQNGKRNHVGTQTKIELINFTIDNYSIKATQTIERTELEINSGKWICTDHVEVIDAIINNINQTNEFRWNSDRIRQGSIINDELVFCVEGNMNGINSKGKKYTTTTKTPLKFKLNCPRIISGKLNLYEESGINPKTIDYGDGTCDSKATISTEYNEHKVSLW